MSSRITITESTSSSLATFAVTDNVVLVPLCVRSTAPDTAKSTAQYTTSAGFTAVYGSYVAQYLYAAATSSTQADIRKDKSYFMASSLLNLGLKVVIKPIVAPVRGSGISYDYASEDAIADAVNSAITTDNIYEEFKSRNLYNIKFITSGAYRNATVSTDTSGNLTLTGCHKTMLEVAASRGDAIALVELDSNIIPGSSTSELSGITDVLKNYVTPNATYAACTYPACTFAFDDASTLYTTSLATEMPGAYAYLTAFANSVTSNANWIAAAGISRGKIIGMAAPKYEITEALANILSGVDTTATNAISSLVNPITKLGSYGYRVFGNKTMATDTSAESTSFTNFLNVRLLMCDIKKQIYDAATRLTFEPNDDITYINFKTLVNVLLDKMVSGRGLDYYTWTAQKADNKGTIKAQLTIKPIEAVEAFDINILLTDSDATVSEEI